MFPLTENKRMLGYELLSAYPNISHFVTTRQGGCSRGTYGWFNCSPFNGDDPENVRRNQEILKQSLGAEPWGLIIPKQVHGTEICVIDKEFLSLPSNERIQKLTGVDAVVTNLPGYCVCVSTADCIPLLIYDPVKQVVAAVHAGWRGTVNKIASRVIGLMQETYDSVSSNLVVCIGPGISATAFEVGEEVVDKFSENGFDMKKISYRNSETRKSHIDLWEANRLQLLDAGVPEHQIECAGLCTYTLCDTFFSARRLGIDSGRILSGIMLKE